MLDTHALLWWLQGGAALAPKAVEVIANPESEIWVSAASVWEISIKSALGRLDGGPTNLDEAVRSNAFLPLPITFAHASRAGNLPPHHSDPFDRMLVAQAQHEKLTIVTRDSAISRYRVPCLSA